MSCYIDTTLYEKRPDDRLDFDVDFSRWLSPGDSIASVDQVAVDDASSVEIDAHDFTDSAVKVWLTGGAPGETATVTVEITSTQGRTKETCFRVRVREGCQ
jgi:hypothetical protein